jgi:hypothetical protein
MRPIALGHRRRAQVEEPASEAAGIGFFTAADGARLYSLGDLNFIEEPSMVVWIIRQIGC